MPTKESTFALSPGTYTSPPPANLPGNNPIADNFTSPSIFFLCTFSYSAGLRADCSAEAKHTEENKTVHSAGQTKEPEMPYLDVSIIKSSMLSAREKEMYIWYFNEISYGYYSATAGSQQEATACRWMQELTLHFWADVERTMHAANSRLTDNLSQMMSVQCNTDSAEREEEKRRMREVHELLCASVDAGKSAGSNRGRSNGDALSASHWS